MSYLLKKIGYAYPSKILSNKEISKRFPEWNVEKIKNKVGIESRFICDSNEDSLSLALKAVQDLKIKCNGELDFDFLIYVSASSKNIAPSDGHLLLNLMNVSGSVCCVEINQGCSGYTHALGIARSLIKSDSANRILIVTSETYSKYINHNDKGNLSIFGDAATTSMVVKNKIEDSWEIKNFKYGSNGNGSQFLNINKKNELYMDGGEVFKFTANTIVKFILNQKLDFENKKIIFHQANSFMLNYMRKKLKINIENFLIDMSDTGNTVSSSIPLVIGRNSNLLKDKSIFLCGFGIGLSYSSVELI